jgi:hypothetical protein
MPGSRLIVKATRRYTYVGIWRVVFQSGHTGVSHNLPTFALLEPSDQYAIVQADERVHALIRSGDLILLGEVDG